MGIRRILIAILGSLALLTSAPIGHISASAHEQTSLDSTAGFYPVREPFVVPADRAGFDIDIDPATGLMWHTSGETDEVYATDASGNVVLSFGELGFGNGQLNEPSGLSIKGQEIFVAERNNGRVQVFDKVTGSHLRNIGQIGAGNGDFANPCGVEVVGNRVYVADIVRNDIQVFTLAGAYIDTMGSTGAGDGELSMRCGATGLAAFGGELFVADSSNARVSVFDLNGNWQRQIGQGQINQPNDLEFDSQGNLWVAESQGDTVSKWSRSGIPMGTVGTSGTLLGQFEQPMGLEVDPNGQTLWVTSTEGADRIQEFTSVTCLGQPLTHAGSSFADVIVTDNTAAVIHLGTGDDRAVTGSGDDRICGGAGDDEIRAGLGSDFVQGLAGDDLIYGQGGDDELDGGPGVDRIFGQGGDDTIRGNTGNDILRGGAHDDTIGGDAGNDLIFGNTGADIANGNGGNDIVRGQANADTLNGGAGNDRIVGGGGNDVHNGGPGTDVCLEGASQGLPETYLSCETQP